LTKVLVADDNALMIVLLQALLEMEGYEVVTISDGRGVVDLVVQEKPDLVVVDYYLGEESGLETLRAIRRIPAVADTPVVMTSALDHRRDAERGGADGFLLKPFESKDLIAMIQKSLDRRRSRPTGHDSRVSD
jgi:CheY-like chemotaxis protein